MTSLLARHLGATAVKLGRFLRGFDDPAVHTGTPAAFAREMDRLFDLSAIAVPDGDRRVSYRALVAMGAVSGAIVAADDSPVRVLLDGLAGPARTGARPRIAFDAASLEPELEGLLREPALRFFFDVSDAVEFAAGVVQAGVAGGLRLAFARTGQPAVCPACGGAAAQAGPDRPLVCRACGVRSEHLRLLANGHTVAGVVSFEALRRLVALGEVERYQEAPEIVALAHEAPAGEAGRD